MDTIHLRKLFIYRKHGQSPASAGSRALTAVKTKEQKVIKQNFD
jgi:hypothetical protein